MSGLRHLFTRAKDGQWNCELVRFVVRDSYGRQDWHTLGEGRGDTRQRAALAANLNLRALADEAVVAYRELVVDLLKEDSTA